MIRPFVQGDSQAGRQRGRQYVLVLAAAHVAAASLTVFVLSMVGKAVSALLPGPAIVVGVVAAATVGVAVDVLTIRRGGYSVGMRRQTPERLKYAVDEWWVAALLWGADTGTIGTTFRVSFASWLLLILAVLGVAPPWAGVVYGLSFTVPLIVAVSSGDSDVIPASMGWLTRSRPAQVVGVVAMSAALPLLLWP